MRTIPGVPELRPHGARDILDALAIYRARFDGASLVDPLRPFIGLKGYHWRAFVSPDAANQTLAPSATFEDHHSIAAGSFLLGVSAFSQQSQGFRYSIIDRGTKQSLSTDRFNNNVAGGPLIAGGLAGSMPVWLPAPWMLSRLGMLVVQLVNLSTVANSVNLVLHVAEAD